MRSLVGLDREAVNEAVSEFLEGRTATRYWIKFIDFVVGHLAKKGPVVPDLLNERPLNDIASQGPEQVFDATTATKLFRVLKELNQSAVA